MAHISIRNIEDDGNGNPIIVQELDDSGNLVNKTRKDGSLVYALGDQYLVNETVNILDAYADDVPINWLSSLTFIDDGGAWSETDNAEFRAVAQKDKPENTMIEFDLNGDGKVSKNDQRIDNDDLDRFFHDSARTDFDDPSDLFADPNWSSADAEALRDLALDQYTFDDWIGMKIQLNNVVYTDVTADWFAL